MYQLRVLTHKRVMAAQGALAVASQGVQQHRRGKEKRIRASLLESQIDSSDSSCDHSLGSSA